MIFLDWNFFISADFSVPKAVDSTHVRLTDNHLSSAVLYLFDDISEDDEKLFRKYWNKRQGFWVSRKN